jgi:hypothetical protein
MQLGHMAGLDTPTQKYILTQVLDASVQWEQIARSLNLMDETILLIRQGINEATGYITALQI